MIVNTQTDIEKSFWSLPPKNRNVIISHGTALMLSDLRNRHFLAVSKVQHFEANYETSLSDLEAQGLPDNADYEMHEDYIMWQHWASVAAAIEKDIISLEEIAQQGVYLPETRYTDKAVSEK